MRNTFYKGESILVKFKPIDRSGLPIPWASITALSVVVTDTANTSVTYSKAGGQITESSGIAKFEITPVQTSSFRKGRLTARFTYTVTDAAYTSGVYVDIIEEGFTQEFINLQ